MLSTRSSRRPFDHRRTYGWSWLLLGLLMAAPTLAAAQSPMSDGEKEAPVAKKARGRLPAHFARVVSSQQRESIYRLQANYAEKIAALKDQIAKFGDDLCLRLAIE